MRNTIIILVLIAIIGCGKKETETTGESATVQLRSKADAIVGMYMKELKGELMTAMQDGPANAISVCSEQAPMITEKYSQNGWTISRVSDKNRNSGNRVDEHQAVVLALFADTLQKLDHFDEWLVAGDSTFVFYKPIRTNPLCLKCHGTMENLDTEVVSVLKEKYPEDMAVGYESGDLRGMFVVEAKTVSGVENLLKAFSDSL
ncbi:MAG: DUF3365 domain-containing protein [Calditrichaeota bacterium]|nr:MAG: DUF3365 domain-containing protein [Calditrichota bacterium]